MKTIRFGRTNARVPTISLGTWGHGGPNVSERGESVGWKGHDDAEARKALVAAWRAGITHWDTADAYGDGHAETLIGEVWGEVRRSDVFVASKFGYVYGPANHPYDPAFMRSQAEGSLRRMRIDVIDLYYFHHCDFGPGDVYFDDALDTMRRLREEGKIRFIGLSHWDSAVMMRYIDRVDPDAVQPLRNLINDDYESSGLATWVREHDAGVAFFSPLKHGLLLGKYDKAVDFGEGDFRSGVAEFKDQAAIDHYRRAAAEMRARFKDREEPVLHAVTGALLTGNPTACVLLGQRNERQVEAAAKAGDALSGEDAAWVRSVYRR